MHNLEDVINADLCIACGACKGISKSAISYFEHRGIPIPQLDKNEAESLFQFCPGKGYDILKMGRDLYGNESKYDVDLGFYNSFYAAKTKDPEILKNASSGGMITTLLDYLISTNMVQGAVVTKFSYGPGGPSPMPYIAINKNELLDAQGSKYCPVSTLNILQSVRSFPGKVVWVGTPCQIAALRLIQSYDCDIKNKVILTIANFCGGFRDFREVRRLAEICEVNYNDITALRYRGDGQPGFMRIENCHGKKFMLPYPDYVRYTGYSKIKRCRLCVDATGELADFACGDAWIPRFLRTKIPWSIVLARSFLATDILNQMKAKQAIVTEEISISELIKSQSDNLYSKKKRHFARSNFYSLFFGKVPVFDGGFYEIKSGFFLELRVHCKYLFFVFLEKIKLYRIVAKLIGRYR